MAAPFHSIERSSTLPVSAEEAFAWHQRPGALERLTPPWERIELLQRTGGIEDGGRATYRVHLGPLSSRWVAQYRDVLPGRRFVDEQVEGPFTHWIHQHLFEPLGPSTSRYTDHVEFAPPFGTLGAAAGLWMARPRIERMLAHRHALLPADLAAHLRFRHHARIHVAVTGASGMLGSALIPFLTTGGHRVTPVSRRPRPAGMMWWEPASGAIEVSALEGVDAVVHLAGENIGKRWTGRRKRRIRQSRVEGTRLLAEALAELERPPRVLVSASAMGIYGNRGDEVLTEDAVPVESSDFLVQLGRDWEAAAEPARAAGVRVVHLRFGLILSPAGGMLGRMLPIFRAGLGGPLGSGKHWVSWISLDDAIGAVHHALFTSDLSGPVNTAAPEPVTSRRLAETLGRVLHRPALVPAPALALRLLFGEMADQGLLASQRLSSERLVSSGYSFRHPDLESALRHELGRPSP
ncbi:MAG TPA: TIGR01777 family oxidoreductase [Gemmatimonadales bacterium]|jgi:hypothetical protein